MQAEAKRAKDRVHGDTRWLQIASTPDLNSQGSFPISTSLNPQLPRISGLLVVMKKSSSFSTQSTSAPVVMEGSVPSGGKHAKLFTRMKGQGIYIYNYRDIPTRPSKVAAEILLDQPAIFGKSFYYIRHKASRGFV